METNKKRVIIKFHLLIILFLLISCGKDTNTNTNVITIGNNITDTYAPQCTVKINNGDSATDSIDVTLSLSATDDTGVTGYYISESSMTPSLTGSGWELTSSAKSYSATVSYSLSSGSGTKTVYIWFRDAADRISTVASDSITFSSSDTTAPSSPSVSINSGDASTTSTAVTLILSASDDVGVTGYCAEEASATPSGNDSCWTSVTSTTNYSATVNFTLSSGSLGDNTKTVYVWFRDSAGNISSSASDSITLTVSDAAAPSSPSISIDNDATSTTSTSVTLTLSATDSVGVTGYCAKESSTTPSSNDTCWTSVTSAKNYSATVNFTLSSSSGTKTVYVWFRDTAGNVSASASDSITLTVSDATAPSNPSISINSGDASTTSTAATLSLSATDDVGVTGYCAKESSTTPSGNNTCWTTVTSTTSYSATVPFTLSSGVVGDNTKTVYVWFRDSAGNISQSASANIILTISDTTAPSSPSILINNGDTSTTSTSVTLSLSATDNVGVTGYCAKESSATPSATDSCWTSVTSTTSYSATVSFTLSSGSGTKTVYVWFRDTAGNISSSASDSITYSSTPTTLASGVYYAYGIAVDSTYVYWTNYDWDVGTVKKVSKNGGTVTTLASGLDKPGGIAVDSTNVYWTEYGVSKLKKISKNGGTVTTLASTSGGSFIAVDSTNLYWIEYNTVKKMSINGGTITTILSGLDDPFGIAVDSASVYWSDGGGTVKKMNINGEGVTTLASGLDYPYGIAIDSTNIYWMEYGGTIKKVSINGGTVTTFASGVYGIGIAVDSTNVYWTDYYGGTVNKIAK